MAKSIKELVQKYQLTILEDGKIGYRTPTFGYIPTPDESRELKEVEARIDEVRSFLTVPATK